MSKEELQKYVIWALIVILSWVVAYSLHNRVKTNKENRLHYKVFDYYDLVDLMDSGNSWQIIDYSMQVGQEDEYGQDTVIFLKQVLKKSK